MLGEVHSLEHEFPELKEALASLLASDEQFASDNKSYNHLDTEIRKLELNNAPIADDEMHHLKQQRAALKDSLYQRLLNANE